MDTNKLYQIFLESSAVSTDTRTIAPGSLFIALKGANFDANELVGQALEQGAKHVVTTNKAFASDHRVTIVDDTLTALQQLALEHRNHLTIPVIGITGTNGKTTTKELTTAVLSKKYKTVATKGNLNNHIGVPLTLLSIPREAEMAVVEMGASHPGEIKTLAAIARPTAGLITNVGIGHIEGFGSFDGVMKTKRELYDQIKETHGTIFIDGGNDNLRKMLGGYDKKIVYGTADDTNYAVRGHVTKHAETLHMAWDGNEGHSEIATNITGEYNVYNVLAAAAVGQFFGVPAKDINEAVSNYTPTNGRSQIVQTSRNRLILDAYNANPTSMAAALANFQTIEAQGKVVILGKMGELGTEEVPQHIALLERLKTMKLDKAILVGDEFCKHKDDYKDFLFFRTTAEAAEAARDLSGKYILIKGSNSNHLSELVKSL